MNAGWAASWAAVAVAGACGVLLYLMDRHGRRLPGIVHPQVHRLIILGMFVAGAAIALTPLGRYPLGAEDWFTGLFGGTAQGAGHAGAVIIGIFLFLSVLAGFTWVPAAPVAWMALALPFVAALSGGKLHGIVTVLPAVQWASEISHWIGG
jgi:hypothetical protein